jgi:hypothetical protein
MEKEMTIDVNALKDYLTNYFGTAKTSEIPTAEADLVYLDGSSPEDIVKLALSKGIDITEFSIDDREEER